MNYRKLGNSGFKVSEIGLGCWQLGADWGQQVAEEQAQEILKTAGTNEISFYDTADVYGNGRSEKKSWGHFSAAVTRSRSPPNLAVAAMCSRILIPKRLCEKRWLLPANGFR